ncbi:MAG: OmpA family protein [Bacteroidota bacterium]
MKKNVQLFTLVCLGLFSGLNAQTKDKKVNISLGGGINQYNGDNGNGFFKFNDAKYGFGGGSLNFYLNPSFDLGLFGSYGGYGYFNDDNPPIINFLSKLGNGGLRIKYKFDNGYILKETSKLSPYIFVGASYSMIKDNTGNGRASDQSMLTYNAGAGLTYKITEAINIGYNIGFGYLTSDKADFIVKGGKDLFLQNMLTIGFNFGAPKDDDKDLVANKLDKCPNTPDGVKVDLLGCPVDSDNDGTADYLDKCPAIAGVATLNGCPDKDADGVTDAEDKCPEVAGLTTLNGCPDSDGDGVQDDKDACPTVKGLTALNGCPDTDGDGVQDDKDACPTIKGLAEFKGCVDTDKDGVADNEDMCPSELGTIANKGCPEIKEEVKQIFAQALKGIQFETGKDIIKKTSFTILDKVVDVMKTNPSYKLKIEGHTDDQGDDSKNMALSQKRADAVKAYLVKNGIDSSRVLSSTGFGETKPIGDNKTATGRAENRRVEFKVEF